MLAALASSATAEIAQKESLRATFEGESPAGAAPARARHPPPSKLTLAPCPPALASLGFEDGRMLTAALVRSCKAVGA